MANAFIEKLARAMAKADGFNPDASPNYVSKTVMTDVAFPPGTKLWERYIPKVRAVLLAAREPTPEMVNSAEACDDTGMPDERGYPASAKEHWQAMIDSAIQD